MARNRASMREGPLAELFRAPEAAQRQAKEQAAEEKSAEKPRAEQPKAPQPVPIRRVEAVAPAPVPDPEPAQRPVARWLDPLPDQPARLERARDSASYLAVI